MINVCAMEEPLPFVWPLTEPDTEVVQAKVEDATFDVRLTVVGMPLQMVEVAGVAVAVGLGLTVTTALPEAVQPVGAVTVTA